MVLILLIASFLRWHDLPHVPPGLTHDEADHGLDAWGVVQGVRPIYFTVGYGREPLYDYSTALLMSFLGPTYLAGRLTSVYFSLLLIAGAFAWIKQAIGGRTALLTAAALALSFWPLMTARQALRSETLPALFVLAVAVYWKGYKSRDWRLETKRVGTGQSPSLPVSQSPFFYAALLLALTFYTYIPSRILWLVFPALLVYLAAAGRGVPWRETLLVLLIAALLGLPLFAYLLANPEAELRIGQLALPLQQAARGDFSALWANVRSGLGIFTVAGDPQWRYNIAGKPLLSPLAGALFYGGVLWSAWRVLGCLWQGRRRQQPAATHCRPASGLFLALVWLALGLAPTLATGRELSTTQAIGMQPVLYLFPAWLLVSGAQRIRAPLQRRALPAGAIFWGAALAVALLLLATTWRDYFQIWALHPQVAVQYEAELAAIVRRLDEVTPLEAPLAISTDAPGPFHDAATARLMMAPQRPTPRWFDGRYSLLLPGAENGLLVFSASAPLNPDLAPYLQALQATPRAMPPAPAAFELTHRPGQLLQLYPRFSTEINSLSTTLSTEIEFGAALQLLAYELLSSAHAPGAPLQLATVWRVQRAPSEALVLFTHLLDGGAEPLAQDDRLDAPAASWREGDILVQLHTLQLPADLAPGDYTLAIGAYHAADWRRRLPLSVGGEPAGDLLSLQNVVVRP